MKKLSIYAGIIAVTVTSAAALYAAPGDKADKDSNQIISRAEAIAAGDTSFAKMDINNDGVLNADDRKAMMVKHFARMDSDNNGSISQDEFMANHEAGAERREDRREKRAERGKVGPHGHGAMAMMARADTNGDKAVSQAEFRTAVEARFAKADVNKDGSISMEERQSRRKGKWGGRLSPPMPPLGE